VTATAVTLAPAERKAVDLAIEGHATEAEAALADCPGLIARSVAAAALFGRPDSLRALLDAGAAVDQPTGARRWPPLLTMAFSPFFRSDAESGGLLACARLLLARGADVNVRDPESGNPREGWTPLAGALGARRNLALARLLLEAGAEPSDSETLYHCCERPGLDDLELLHAFGVDPNHSPALLHAIDYDDVDAVRWLLDHGADPDLTFGLPDGHTALHQVVDRRARPGLLDAVLDAGASVDRPRADGLTAYRLAMRSGLDRHLECLAARGADRTATAEDRLLGALMSDRREIVATTPGTVLDALRNKRPDLTCLAAWQGDCAALALLLDLGWPLDCRGHLGGTPLHQASFRGHATAVELLLARGADPAARCDAYNASPLDWCTVGAQTAARGHFSGNRDGHGTVRALLAASA